MEKICGVFLCYFDIAHTHRLQTAVETEPPKLHIMCVTPGVRREIIIVLKLYGKCQE